MQHCLALRLIMKDGGLCAYFSILWRSLLVLFSSYCSYDVQLVIQQISVRACLQKVSKCLLVISVSK